MVTMISSLLDDHCLLSSRDDIRAHPAAFQKVSLHNLDYVPHWPALCQAEFPRDRRGRLEVMEWALFGGCGLLRISARKANSWRYFSAKAGLPSALESRWSAITNRPSSTHMLLHSRVKFRLEMLGTEQIEGLVHFVAPKRKIMQHWKVHLVNIILFHKVSPPRPPPLLCI
jgi:hypothetical protein